MTVAEAELVRAIRYKTSISLLMIDIDYFKKINDSNGHKAGDTVLRKLAEIFHCTLRKVDHAGRWGGEEFTIMLPETDINQAKEVAERLRELVYATQIEIERGINITFTISVGVSTLTPENQDLEHLLNMADKALYVAKESGRNQVVTYNKPFGSEFSESLTQSM
jgi:diguanylate cyclase (GGDEF)-like protein